MTDQDRRWAERKIGFAKLWARTKQVLTTDPQGADTDDRVVDEEGAKALASHAGRLKGGLAKVAQLAAYDPRSTGATDGTRAVLGALWDQAPSVSTGSIATVIERDLGSSPQNLFASWDPKPLAAASLGQVHGAVLHDGTEVVVKVQYPGVADALRADLADAEFVRRLAGSEIGRSLDAAAITTLADAVRGELDYRAEAAAQLRFAAAWSADAVLRVPRVIAELSSTHVLTTTRAPGKTVVDVAVTGSPDVRRAAALGIFRASWGSPLVHGLLNADPNPGNFLIEIAESQLESRSSASGPALDHVHVWCLDFGCAFELPAHSRDNDRELWWGLLDDDNASAAERFRMALGRSGLLRRTDSMASNAHRDWERALHAPFATDDFHWTTAYASTLAEATGRVLSSGGLALPADVLLLWRQRLGAAAVIGLLDAHAPFRRTLLDLIGTGRRALR